MVLGASTFFVPHPAKSPPPRATPLSSAVAAATPAVLPSVTVTAEYRLPPQWAYESLIQEAALRHHLDPALIRAVIAAESAFDVNAVSDAGAQGLMQLMPALAAEMGVDDVFDPRQNIMGGVRYLRQLIDAHDGNLDLALASYNAGPGTVQLYGGIPPFPETQQYVKTITTALARSQTATAEPD
jgi:soluble lytic murein transglycosylase-like protein